MTEERAHHYAHALAQGMGITFCRPQTRRPLLAGANTISEILATVLPPDSVLFDGEE
jgi:hypothetical protein